MATWNHTIVPSRDTEAGARFFARIFGLSYDGLESNFAPVRVNEELTLDYDDRSRQGCGVVAFESAHGTESGFEPAVVALDAVVRVLLGVVKRGGDQLFDRSP